MTCSAKSGKTSLVTIFQRQLPVVFGDTPAVDLHICLCTNGSWSWHGCPNETSATTKLGLD